MHFCASIALVILLVNLNFAKDSCRTCRGTACLNKDVFQLDCTQFVPALPFESQLLINDNIGELTYGCLDLEYYIDETLDHIQQCILSTDLATFCDTLEYTLKIEKCEVTSLDKTRNTRSLGDIEASVDQLQLVNVAEEPEPELEEGSGDSTTAESTTGTVETTTAHANVISFMSLLSFIGALFMLVLN